MENFQNLPNHRENPYPAPEPNGPKIKISSPRSPHQPPPAQRIPGQPNPKSLQSLQSFQSLQSPGGVEKNVNQPKRRIGQTIGVYRARRSTETHHISTPPLNEEKTHPQKGPLTSITSIGGRFRIKCPSEETATLENHRGNAWLVPLGIPQISSPPQNQTKFLKKNGRIRKTQFGKFSEPTKP